MLLMNNISEKKKKLRKIQKIKRDKIYNKKFFFKNNIFESFYKDLNLKKIKKFASFFSINSEINTDLLNSYLWKKNKILCFPVIKNKNDSLIFLQYSIDQKKEIGVYKTLEPQKENPELIPEVIIVPCLAFDLNGNRLGYGGGYYDRTFEKLNNLNKNFISIGYAYDDQIVSNVPVETSDYKLDYVLTEKQLYCFK
ncbi:MAG: 5-formyltetrahydrofolate cyclo-ligase [Pelagibacteraceae bacterium]|nr:5-formyltetrahydrofolate cyclo-ligase [Pelagibacteraceae bacterium]